MKRFDLKEFLEKLKIKSDLIDNMIIEKCVNIEKGTLAKGIICSCCKRDVADGNILRNTSSSKIGICFYCYKYLTGGSKLNVNKIISP